MDGQRLADVKQYSKTLGQSYFQRRSVDGRPINLTVIPFSKNCTAVKVFNKAQFNQLIDSLDISPGTNFSGPL